MQDTRKLTDRLQDRDVLRSTILFSYKKKQIQKAWEGIIGFYLLYDDMQGTEEMVTELTGLYEKQLEAIGRMKPSLWQRFLQIFE